MPAVLLDTNISASQSHKVPGSQDVIYTFEIIAMLKFVYYIGQNADYVHRITTTARSDADLIYGANLRDLTNYGWEKLTKRLENYA